MTAKTTIRVSSRGSQYTMVGENRIIGVDCKATPVLVRVGCQHGDPDDREAETWRLQVGDDGRPYLEEVEDAICERGD